MSTSLVACWSILIDTVTRYCCSSQKEHKLDKMLHFHVLSLPLPFSWGVSGGIARMGISL